MPKTAEKPLTPFEFQVLCHLNGEDVENLVLNRSFSKARADLVTRGFVEASVKMSGVQYVLTEKAFAALRGRTPKVPTEAAFYWAKYGDGEWEVVLVVPDRHEEDKLGVLMTGVEKIESIDEFEWGPRVIKPEGL